MNYAESSEQPDSLHKMAAMWSGNGAAPRIVDPTTVAGQTAFRIFLDAKSLILRSDGTRDRIREIFTEAIERTRKEVLVEKVRDKAVEKFEKMIAALPSDQSEA